MNKPHKHAAIIKAWADGAQIQMYSKYNKCWQDVDPPVWGEETEYRVKPEPIKLSYRVALFKGYETFYTVTASDDYCNSIFESKECFVRWLTDWIEVEV